MLDTDPCGEKPCGANGWCQNEEIRAYRLETKSLAAIIRRA